LTNSIIKLGNIEINLENYALTNVRRGFFEIHSDDRTGDVDKLAKVGSSLMQQYSDMEIHSNIHSFGGLNAETALHQGRSPEDDAVLSDLYQRQLISFYECYKDVPRPCKISGISVPELANLLRAFININGVKGHCLISLNESLVIYPHDDVGFGYFCNTDNNELKLAKFFNEWFEENQMSDAVVWS